MPEGVNWQDETAFVVYVVVLPERIIFNVQCNFCDVVG